MDSGLILSKVQCTSETVLGIRISQYQQLYAKCVSHVLHEPYTSISLSATIVCHLLGVKVFWPFSANQNKMNGVMQNLSLTHLVQVKLE